MALVVFVQEDEDVPSVYCNLKIFCETAPWPLNISSESVGTTMGQNIEKCMSESMSP